MPAPYPIGDERALVDWLNNVNYQGPGPSPTGLQGQQTGRSSATAAISNTETVVIQSQVITNATLRAGSLIRVVLDGTSTSTVANTTTFNLYFGTTGTVSDTKIGHVTTAAAGTTGTNIPFKLIWDFNVYTVGAAGTGNYNAVLVANAATAIAGGTGPFVFNAANDNAFNTVTGLFITVTCVNAAATTAETFQTAYIEVLP